VLTPDTVERFLYRASSGLLVARIAALDALVELGVPSEAGDTVGQVAEPLLSGPDGGLDPTQLDRLCRVAGRIPNRSLRRSLYRHAAGGSARLRRAIIESLGKAHDPAALDALIHATTARDRNAAHIVATFPTTVLDEHMDRVRQQAERVADIDTRLWLAIAVAKGGDAAPLKRVLAHVGGGDVPRALYGPTWAAIRRFRQIGGMPNAVNETLRGVAMDHDTSAATRYLASLITGDHVYQLAASSDQRDLAERVCSNVMAIGTNDAKAAAALYPQINVLSSLDPARAAGVLEKAVGLSISDEVGVRALARGVSNAVAVPAYLQGATAKHPVVGAFDVYDEARSRHIDGFTRTPAALALGIGTSDELAHAALHRVDMFTDTDRQIATFDLTRDAAHVAGEDMPTDAEDAAAGVRHARAPIGIVTSPETEQRQVHPRLRPAARSIVQPGAQFVLEVGVQPAPDPTLDETFVGSIPATGVHQIVVHLFSDLFLLADPLRSRLLLTVTDADPFPYQEVTFEVPTLSELGRDPSVVGTIRATFYLDAALLGIATCRVPIDHGASECPADEPSSVTFHVVDSASDLTITVTARGSEFHWTVGPRTGLPLGLEVVHPSTDSGAIASEIRELLDKLANGVFTGANVHGQLPGKWRRLRDAIPTTIWAEIERAADAAQERSCVPAVVLITDDPNVPWEAAAIERDLVEAPPGIQQAPFLGAQIVVGRIDGHVDQALSPPPAQPMRSIRFLAPRYERTTTLKELGHAQEEVDRITHELALGDTAPLPDDLDGFLGFLDGRDYPDILHVAAHGRLDGPRNDVGLPLLGATLDNEIFEVDSLVPDHVNHRDFQRRTFVFLNLCFAAAGASVLGQAVSLADAFTRAGARGVVAPLWQVEDSRAADFALELYRIARSETLAEAVRQLRNRYLDDRDLTWLAYRFFGHPQARLALPTNIVDDHPPA
jgi:hypothetical protein